METSVTFFDLETNGLTEPDVAPLDKQPRVIEIAMLTHIWDPWPPKNDQEPIEKSELNELINPGSPVSKEITKITGIKNSDLRGKPQIGRFWNVIHEVIRNSNFIVAHNLAFDKSVLDYEAKRMRRVLPWPEGGLICTVEFTEHFKGYRLNLDQLYQHCFGKKPSFKSRHRAMKDVEFTSEIYYHLLSEGEI